MLALGVFPRFDESLRQVAAALNEERAGTHRHVADFESEDLLGDLECPLGLRQALGRADVHQGSSVCFTIGSVSERGV